MSSRSCLSVKNDPYITKLGEQFGLEPVVAHAEVGAWMDINNSSEYPTSEQFREYLKAQVAVDLQDSPEAPVYNSILRSQDRINKAFTPQEREERAKAIADLFSRQIDQMQEENESQGISKTRAEIINEETPMGIFIGVKEFIEYAAQNPDVLGWSQEQVDIANKTLEYFFDLVNLSSRYLSQSEGFSFSLHGKEVDTISQVPSDPQTGEDTDTNINDPLYREESMPEAWTIKHQHTSAKSTLSRVVRRLLSRIPQTDIDGNIQRDILGFQKNLNPDLVHSILIDKLRFMTKSKHLMPMLEELSETRPWVKSIINVLQNDKSLRSKFYTDFRKDFNQFYVVNRTLNRDGSYSYKTISVNRPMGVDYLLSEWQENYDSGTIISPMSIYDDNNRVNTDNVAKVLSTLKDLQSSIRETKKTQGSGFDFIADWVTDNIDDITSVFHAIGISQDKDLIQAAFNRNPRESASDGVKFNHRIGDVLNQLTTMMTTIQNKNIGFKDDTKQPVDWIKEFSKVYKSIANVMSSVAEDAIESSSYENGKSYYSHQVPNYLNKLIKNFKYEKGEDFENFIKDQFEKFHQFFDFKTNQLKDGWVKDLKEDPSSRKLLDIHTMLNYNKTDYSDLGELDYTISLIQQFFGTQSNSSAWYHVPILSDSPAGVFIKFKRYADGKDTILPMREVGRDENDNPLYERMSYKEVLLDKFSTVAQQEYERIRLVRQREELLSSDTNLKPIDNFESRGLNFQFFPSLNSRMSEIDALYEQNNPESKKELQDLYKEAIAESLDSEFQKAIDSWESIGVFDRTQDGVFENLGFKTKNEADVMELLENYFWNSAYASTQIIQMTTGDLSFYKNIEDFQKRNKQIYSPANRLDTESEYGRDIQRTVILNDVYLTSNSHLNIQEALRVSELPVDQIREVMSSYVVSDSTRGINQTDAQAYSSLNAFRAMEDMMGEWNDQKQALFDKLIAHSKGNGPKFTAQDFHSLTQMNSKKPFVYTQKAVDSGIKDDQGNTIYIKTPFQNKNAHYLITIAGLMARSPQIVALNEFMMKHNIDVVQFESSVKDGSQGAIDISNLSDKDQIVSVLELNTGTEQGLWNPFLQSQTIHEVPYEDFGIQQPVEDHITDFTQLFGTQFRKIIAGDLPSTPGFTVNVNGKNYNKKEWLDLYNDIIVENVLQSFLEAKEVFGSNESLEEVLLSEVRSNSRYSRDLEAAITLDSNGNFPIPLYEEAQSIQLQQLLSAIVKNRVTKQKIKGGQLVQISNFGFSDDLSVRFKDKDGDLVPTLKEYLKANPGKTNKDYRAYLSENQNSLAYYEVYMPAYSKDFLQDFMNEETGEVDVSRLPDDLRKAIGYRVPTEAHYSIVPMYIKGFLPSYAGSQIMMPADITAVTGSDFDVDKIYVMLPEYSRLNQINRAKLVNDILEMYKAKTAKIKGKKTISEVRSDINSAIDQIINGEIVFEEGSFEMMVYDHYENNKDAYTKVVYKKHLYDSSKGAEYNSLASRNNMLIDMAWGILTAPEMLPNMFIPQSFDIQKKAARIVTLLNNTSRDELQKALNGDPSKILPSLTLQELEDLSSRFHQEMNMINPIAQVFFHQQNMVGAAMIGIAANHNSNHALMQQTEIGFSDDMAIFFDGVTKKSLHDQYNEMRELISRNVSGYLAASVDNAKDPVLRHINLNSFTADVTFSLVRAGFSPLSVSLFMTQPVMIELTNYYFKNKSSGRSRDNIISSFISDYMKEHDLEIINDDTPIDIRQSDLISMMQADRDSKGFHQKQYEVLLKFTEFLDAADIVSQLTSATRSDTVNGAQGPSFAHTETKINRVLDYLSDNKIYEDEPLVENGDIIIPFISLEQDNMSNEEYASHIRSQIKESKLPMLQAFYSLGLASQEALVSKFFPHFRSDFRYVQNQLRNMTFRKKLSPQTMNKVYSDLFAYIMSANDYFTGGSAQALNERFNYYTKDFVQEFKNIKSSEKYADNSLIKHLSIAKADNNNPIPYIRFKNVGSLSSEQKLQIVEAWADLLYQGEDGIKLANDLFIYNYFKNGFAFGPESFIHLAPTILKVNISQYKNSLEAINNQSDDAQDRYEYFIDQFLLNRSYIRELVPKIEGETSFDWVDNDGAVNESVSFVVPGRGKYGSESPEGDMQFIVRFEGNRPMMKRFVTVTINGKDYIYKHVGNSEDLAPEGQQTTAIYNLVDRLGYNNHYIQYLYGERADYLAESLDGVQPLSDLNENMFFSEDYVPRENDYMLDVKSSGLPFRSAKRILEEAKAKSQLERLGNIMEEEGYTDSNPMTNDPLDEGMDDRPLSKEEGDEIRRIVANFQKKGRKMFSLQEESDAILRSIGGYGRDGNFRRFIDPVEAENKARDFNKNHPLRNRFVASTVKGWNRGPDNYIFYRLQIKPRTTLSSIESNRASYDRQLNIKIRNILKSMGVSIGALNELERRQMLNGVMDTSQANEVVDGVVELIRLAKGERGERALPEEFAHFAIEALGDNPIVDRLINLVSNNNFIEEILGESYDKYNEAYQGDQVLLAKEAIGKLLAKHFLNNTPVPQSGWKALYNRVVQAIKNFWSKLPGYRLTRARAELNSEFSEVAEGLLEGVYSGVMSVDNIRNKEHSVTLAQIGSLQERVRRDRKILKNMVEAETKLLHATTRETSFDKDSFRQKELIEKLNKRLERGTHREEIIGISEYIDGALQSLNGIDERVMEIYNDKDNITKPEEALSILRDAYYVFTAYGSVLKQVQDDLSASYLKGEDRFDDKIMAQISEAESLVKKMEAGYRELSVELFARFLDPFLGKGIKDIYKAKTGQNIDISALLVETDHDIGMLSRWLESMSRVNDLPSQLIDSVVKKQKNDARAETIDVAKEIQAAMIKLEQSGVKNTDWLFERDENGNVTGNYISDVDVAAYEKAKHVKRNEIHEKYKGDESLQAIAKRQQEFMDWVSANTELVDGHRRPIKEIYPSSQFSKLNSAQREYYKTFMDIKNKLDLKLPPETVNGLKAIMIRKDLLERMTKSGSLKNAGSQLVDSIKDTFVRRADDTDFGEYHRANTILDFEGNEINSLPIYYIKDLEDMSALSLDATSTLTAYAFMVNDYAKMNKVIDALEVGRNVLKNRDVQERQGGKPKAEVIENMGRVIEQRLFKKGAAANVFQRLNDYYSMQIYGRYMKDQGVIKGTNIQISKVANFINQATSASTMWLSAFVGATNALTGAAQMNIEAVAGEHFSAKDIAKADYNYFKDIPQHLAQLGKRVKTSKLSLIDEMFNANQNSEVRYQHSNMDRRNIFSKLFSMETMYFMSTSGEHWMHMRTVLAVMEGYRMKDSRGKETSLYNALEVVYTDPNDHNKGAKLRVKPGYTKLDGSEFTQDDINAITNKSATINQDLHGVYNKIDRDAFQALAQGRMIEMFRKWMVRSIMRRYGKAQYVVELDQEVEGFYRTMGQFAINLLKDMRRMQFFTATQRFKELSKHQQANIRRALMDVGQALMISSLLAFIDWDDDDDSWIKNALEYQLRRERTELLAPMPLPQGMFEEGRRILQSPMAGMTFISNVSNLLQFWNWFDEVSRGRYEGRTNLEKNIMELIPLNKTIYGIAHPEERLLFYKRDM